MFERGQILEGMTVRSMDGEKLGRVYATSDTEFFIEKGIFFPKEYACKYSEISDIRNGEVILIHGRESLERARGMETKPEYTQEGYTTTGIGTPPVTGATTSGVRASSEVVIPVHREEVDVVKRQQEAGEVRVHKDVVVEEQVMEVPVRRERAVVERREVERPAMGATFQEETIAVPLRAEEVSAEKRAMVEEEVVIRKEEVEETERVAESVRREEVEIRTPEEGGAPRTLKGPGKDKL